MRRFRRDHTPEEEQHQEELQEEQEENQEDKEEHESCVVEASLPDLLPASWQQSVLLPDLLDNGSDAPDGGGSRENNGSTGSNGEGREMEERSGVEAGERVGDGRGEERRGQSDGRHLKRMEGIDQVI